MVFSRLHFLLAILLVGSVLLLPLTAQTPANASIKDRVTQAIDNRNTVLLKGNRHPLARAEYDRGAVAPDLRMERMLLVLAAEAGQQADLDELVEAQHNPASPLYHRWITPAEYGSRFGISSHDLDEIQSWLTGQGLQVEEIPAGLRSIVFSGTASQVAAAFHTEIHSYSVNGEAHFGNASDPEIPAALAEVVAGVASLHDFLSQPALASVERVAPFDAPFYTSGGSHYMSPADFATIYDINPLYSNSVDGTGTSVAVVARSNVNPADVTSFRNTMGLPANNPTIILNGVDPGVTAGGEQTEATLDVEWAGALARKAAVKMVVSASGASDGVLLSAQYIVNHNTAPVMTTSFGSCEAANGAAATEFWSSLWQQAAAEGITSFVAAGDSGAAGCDAPTEAAATLGKGVNAIASSAYSVAVGGTEFNDTANPGLYWSATNSTTPGSAPMSSALSYIPEQAWNSSGTVAGGSDLWAGAGGASMIFSQPSWQTGNGVPAGAFRNVPDVSVAASTHDAYLIEMNGNLYAVGGTSAATPSWAGLMALVVQRTAAVQGNANPNLYALFRLQSAGGAAVFHDITSGNTSVPGLTGFAAGTGYDQATGIGAPDAFLLVQHWTDTSGPSLNLNLSASTVDLGTGSSVQVNASTTAGGGFSAAVALSVTGLPAGLTANFSASTMAVPGAGSSTLTLTAAASLTPGVYSLTLKATGGGIVQTASLVVTATAPSFVLSANQSSLTLQQGGTGQVTLTVAPSGGFSSAVTFSSSGLPTGVTAAFSPASFGSLGSGAGSSTVTFAASASAAVSQANVTLTATGGGVTEHLVIAVTLQQALSLSASPPALSFPQGGSGQIVLTVTPASVLAGATIYVSGLPSGVIASGSVSAGSMTVFLSASGTAASGTHTLTFSIASGGVTKTAPVTLTITALPFALSEGSSSLTLAPGASGNVSVTVTSAAGFTSAVALSASGLPAGVSAAFTPTSVAGVGTHISTLRITVPSGAKAGLSSFSISASGGGTTLTLPVTLRISGTSPSTVPAR
jgi:pseudomonalisin